MGIDGCPSTNENAWGLPSGESSFDGVSARIARCVSALNDCNLFSIGHV